MIAAQEKPDYGYYGLPDIPSEPSGQPAGSVPRRRIRSERRARMVFTALILSVFALGIVYVLVNAFTTNVGYRLENLKHQVATIEAENQSLEMQINKRDTLTRIETVALIELGMVAPTEENTLMVAITRPDTAPEPAESAPAGMAAAAQDNRSDPSLLEALLGFICGREPGDEVAHAG